MSKILELRQKRAQAWDAAKAFLEAKRGNDGMLSAEDTATYDKMEAEVVNLGKEIERLERQAVIDAELSKATSTPLTGKPGAKANGGEEKAGRASDEYADGIEYYIINNNQGYDGDLELAMIPESFRTDILKETADANKVLVENANSETGRFALLFEFDGDVRKIRHVLYNCSASRPSIESQTNEEDKEVQTETLTIKARPMADGRVKAKTGDSTIQSVYEGWYGSVYEPSAEAASVQRTASITSATAGK